MLTYQTKSRTPKNPVSPASRWLAGVLLVLLLQGCDSSGLAGNSNQAFDIANHQGQWVVINYWAEWCAPCKKEIPELNELARQWPDALAVYGVNADGVVGAELSAQSRRMGIEFEVLPQDPRDVLRLARPAALPTTYLFNPQGELGFKLVGPQTAEELLEKMQPDKAGGQP